MVPEPPSTSGLIPFDIPGVDTKCNTWYRIFGPALDPSTVPLICLHGGPGVPHNHLLPIRLLASTLSRPVIFYDQVGCGNSTHLPHQPSPEDFWTVDLFLSELANLVRQLGIPSYDLLGQSWGGMLAAAHAVTQPRGLRRLVLADTPASIELWVAAVKGLRDELPPDVQETLRRHEDDGTTDSAEYEAAMTVFHERYMCRVKPMPQDFADAVAAFKKDPTVHLIMNGPSEFNVTGTLETWSIIPQLTSSPISVPTLLLNGRYDEAQDSVVQPFFDLIPKVKWVRFSESSHVPQFEEPEEFLKVVGGFLSA